MFRVGSARPALAAGLISLGLVFLAACGSSGHPSPSAPDSAPTRSGVAPAACAAVQVRSRLMARVGSSSRSGALRVDVLGDSYSVGAQLPDPKAQTWDLLLAQREHWNLTIRGVGSTGFVNGGPCGDQTYQSRLPQVLADHPQLLIIEGGLNDVAKKGVAAAARRLLRAVPSRVRTVVVGPTLAPVRPATLERRIDSILASVVRDFPRMRYVSTIGWRLSFTPPGLHLTVAGNRQYAAQLSRALSIN